MQNPDPKQQQEYNEFIRESVANGSYFRDAQDWYIFRYVYPTCERTILFFVAIFSGIIAYILFITAIESFPIKQEVPIIVYPKNQSKYFSVIKKLNDSVKLQNIDQAVSKYLLTQYIKKREGFNFRKTNLEALSNQLNYVKNNSSMPEYKKFQNFLNRDNIDSPINYFGKDFQRIVHIESVLFIKSYKLTLVDKARDFIKTDIPSSADIRYRITTKINSIDVLNERYLVKVKFNFSGVDVKSNLAPNFLVNEYELFKIR
jgi:type IV secretory pathway component VirB8